MFGAGEVACAQRAERAGREWMWTFRADMAMTNFEVERARAKGFAGRGSVAGSRGGVWRGWWMWRVESHEAEMSMWCARSYTRAEEGAEWVLRTVCSPVARSILEREVLGLRGG